MRRVPRGYVPILLIDANARFEHGTLTPIKGCNNATKLRELAHQNDMWLSGNTDKHGRPLVTWVAPGSNTGKACLDYIAIPQAWSLGAEVVGDPCLLDVHAGFDHFPVAADFEACVAYHKCEKTVGIDVEQLHSPEGQAKAEQIFLPTLPQSLGMLMLTVTLSRLMSTLLESSPLPSHGVASLETPRCPRSVGALLLKEGS